MLQIFLTAAYIATQGYIADAAKQKQTTKNTTSNIVQTPQAIQPIADKNNSDTKVKSTDLLAELNADLAKEKAANDPFSNKNVKVDVESLGLDAVDNKQSNDQAPDNSNLPGANIIPPNDSQPISDQKDSNVAQAPANITNNQDLKIADLPKIIEPKQDNTPPNNLDQKITNQANIPAIEPKKPDDKDKIIKAPEDNKPNDQTPKINPQTPAITDQKPKEDLPKEDLVSKVKKLITANQEAKQKIEEPEIILKPKEPQIKPQGITDQAASKQEEPKKIIKVKTRGKNTKERLKTIIIDQKKLRQLKEKYLSEFESPADKDLSENSEGKKIIPRKKAIVNFSVNENRPPLLARVYDKNNTHTPVILNHDDKINLLFEAFSKHDPAYFASAYKELLEPNLKNKFGDSILTYAALMQRHDIMATILSEGADPDLTNNLGYTALTIAIELNDYKSVQILLESGANINYTDQFLKTYLMQAVITGFLPIIDLLITNNIDINARDSNGNTALDIAISNNKDIVAKFLIKKGAKKSQE
jgi:hypothetical protein